MVLHADNTNILVEVRGTDVLKCKIASAVKQLEAWFLKNELVLNMAKTCVMSLHSSQCRHPYRPRVIIIIIIIIISPVAQNSNF
jgi:hypothetical protein